MEVGVQRNNKPGELMSQVSADAESVVWELEAVPVASEVADYRGPYISGPPGGRFIYLSWGVVKSQEASRCSGEPRSCLTASLLT